jgi:cell shape-determining protein MreC
MKYISVLIVSIYIGISTIGTTYAQTDVQLNVSNGTSVQELSAKIRILEARLQELQEENTALKNGKNVSTTTTYTGTKASTVVGTSISTG